MYEELDKIDKVKIAECIIDDIRSHRMGELYDEQEDIYEATDNFLSDFLSEVYTIIDEIMTEKYTDENGVIK